MADLESLRALIEESAGRVEAQLREVSGKCDNLARGHEDLSHMLTGGRDPSKGVIVRLDRIEQSEQARAWWLRAIGAGVVASLIAWVKTLLTGVGMSHGN